MQGRGVSGITFHISIRFNYKIWLFSPNFEVFVLRYQKIIYNELEEVERNTLPEKFLGISKI